MVRSGIFLRITPRARSASTRGSRAFPADQRLDHVAGRECGDAGGHRANRVWLFWSDDFGPHQQVEELAQRSVADFDAFYSGRQPPAGSTGDALVLSCDGKGVVMRPDALRAATAAAAAKTSPKLATRLSKGEKRNRKRMAEVGTVYDATPTPRTPADILPATEEERREAAAGPVPANKWLMASVVEDAASVVGRIFDEAERRDPEHQRTWVALVDGNNHQIDRIGAEARARKVSVSVVIDLIHVLEYLWKAAWCFHAEGDPAAEAWVRHHASAVLDGKSTRVAGAIRRAATSFRTRRE